MKKIARKKKIERENEIEGVEEQSSDGRGEVLKHQHYMNEKVVRRNKLFIVIDNQSHNNVLI